MSQQVITTTPVRFRYRTAIIVLGVVAALAIGVRRGSQLDRLRRIGDVGAAGGSGRGGAPRAAAVRGTTPRTSWARSRRCRGASRPRWWARSRRVCPTFSVTWY